MRGRMAPVQMGHPPEELPPLADRVCSPAELHLISDGTLYAVLTTHAAGIALDVRGFRDQEARLKPDDGAGILSTQKKLTLRLFSVMSATQLAARSRAGAVGRSNPICE